MTTPILDFVKKYISSHPQRLHMPGHKGAQILGCEPLDITEIDGADVLYHANGIIKESMDNASALFGSGKTLYSAEGSSLSIRAMLYLAVMYAKRKGKEPLVFAGRNAHKVYIMTSALLDFSTKWLYGVENCGINSCNITKEYLEDELSNADILPCAVYITSPDYLGNIADIRGISEVCRKYGVLLLVDNAHGAYLRFLPESLHPMSLGADICCDSAHKTLPALTGAGYLHISKNAPKEIFEDGEKAMSLFASTSPSYLILQSLDAVNGYLSGDYRERLSEYCGRMSDLKKRLSDSGVENYGHEPLKLTVLPKKLGYSGAELYDILRENELVCEFYDPDHVVMMLTPENGEDVFDKIYKAFTSVPKKAPITETAPHFAKSKTAMSVKAAMMAERERLPLEACIGKIYAGITVSCPPAIPIAVCGEVIDEDTVKLMRYYGETEADVVKE
ncbi:MAG: aminotransferase class V-fold PLP-dependent enzyme [Ruminococcaceae bacterium]|nr:aminotransferase class V-fold PLP-dependent enzyme [Oscillospiraceae bacterium]